MYGLCNLKINKHTVYRISAFIFCAHEQIWIQFIFVRIPSIYWVIGNNLVHVGKTQPWRGWYIPSKSTFIYKYMSKYMQLKQRSNNYVLQEILVIFRGMQGAYIKYIYRYLHVNCICYCFDKRLSTISRPVGKKTCWGLFIFIIQFENNAITPNCYIFLFSFKLWTVNPGCWPVKQILASRGHLGVEE